MWLETPTERALLLGSWVIAEKRQLRAFFRQAKDEPTFPGIHDRDAIVNDHVTTLNGAVGNEGEVGVTLLEGNGPVNKVELDQLAEFLLLKDKALIHQGSPAPARQDTYRGRPPQFPGGAGCIQSVLVQEMNIWIKVAYLFHNLEV